MSDSLLAAVPAETHEALRELLAAELEPVSELRDEVRAYAAGIRVLGRSNPVVDVVTSDKIAKLCAELLDAVKDDADRHRLVQVACQYYTMTFDDDDDGDLGADGFSDDLLVAQAVATLLA